MNMKITLEQARILVKPTVRKLLSMLDTENWLPASQLWKPTNTRLSIAANELLRIGLVEKRYRGTNAFFRLTVSVVELRLI